jgi:hypothetical protein
MSSFSEMTRDDWWLIKNPLLFMAVVLAAIAGIFITLNSMDTSAATELRNARSQLNTARDDLDKIEQEEAAILENIGRYRELAANGVVELEDRLLFLETFAQLRAQHSLFPINVTIEQQQILPLEYAQSARAPGRPVELHASTIDFVLPLLHEDDLARLLTALLQNSGLLQPQRCQLTSRSATGTNFIYLAQHFNANCSLLWYTMTIQPDPTEAQ